MSHGYRILLVDDDQETLVLTKEFLQKELLTFELVPVTSAMEAQEKLTRGNFDAIISDYRMPEIDGLELLERLRKQANQTPFVIFTGGGREDIAIQALNLGANHFLSKDGNPTSVYTELAHIIKTTVIQQETMKLLRESEEQFQVIYEKSPISIILFDSDGRFFDANPAALDLFGFSVLSTIKGIDDFLGSALSAEEREKLQNGEIAKFETTFHFQNAQDSNIPEINPFRHINLDVQITPLNSGKKTSSIGYLVQIQDITARKQIEQRLRRSQKTLQTILDSMPFGITIVGRDKKIRSANKAGLNIMGYETEEEIIGTTCHQVLCPAAEDQCPILDLKSQIHSSECILITKEGKKLTVLKTVIPIMVDAENVLLESFVDITEHKRAEEALRESEEKYRMIHENIEDGYYEVDLAGNFSLVNESMCRILGYSEEELIRLNFQELMDDLTARQVYHHYNTIYRTNKPIKALNYDITQKNGTKRTVETSVALMTDSEGEAIGFRGILRDITDRKRAEEALQESEQKYRELVEELHEGVLAEDSQGLITFANPRLTEILGYSEDELLGKHWSIIVPPEEGKRVMEEHSNRSYGLSSTFESMLRSKAGQIIPVLVSSKPLFTERWEFRGTLSVYTDLSERKQAEQQLARTDKLASLGRISAGVAHELNNPLAFIYLNTESLGKILAGLAAMYHFQTQIEEAVRGNSLSKAQEIIADMQITAESFRLLKDSDTPSSKALENLIRSAVQMQHENLEGLERMIRIIENLLSFSRSRDSEARLETCQLSEILKTATDLLKYEIKDRITLDLLLDDLPPVLGQQDRLTQAFFNLLDNAVDAIGNKPGRIEVTNSLEIGKISITIRDNGAGVSEEDLPKLFEPFFTTKPPGKGTGLGLSIVHEILQAHGGQIFVESRVGVGTEVKVTLPISRVAMDG